MLNASSELYSFGSYTLDRTSRTLTRSGILVSIPAKAFDLLVLMAESGGRLLRERELMDALWNGIFVEESDLAFQISTLRELLGEEGSTWIEAVPKQGYRFRAPVEKCGDTENSGPAAIGSQPPTSHAVSRTGQAWLIAAAGMLVLAAGVAIWMSWPRDGSQKPDRPMHVISATTYSGRETTPSFSPDGNRLAFAWDGKNGDNFNVYVKAVGEERALKLTGDPRPEFSPVWSPDGRHIAYCRDGPLDREIVLIPPLGGPERVLAKLPRQPDHQHPGHPKSWFSEEQQLAWFPDSRFLAVVARKEDGSNAIFRLSVKDGKMHPLTSPLDRSWGDGYPAVSPDANHLAFTRSRTEQAEPAFLYVVPLSDGRSTGAPQLATPEKVDFAGLTWTSDGTRLVFVANRDLWTTAPNDKAPELLPLSGYNPSYPAISAKGDRLAFADSSEDLDIWRIDGPSVKSVSAGAHPALTPYNTLTRLISSTQVDTNPQYSADDSRIAFTSSRAGADDIWVCNGDGSNPVQLTDLNAETGTPRWSPDGGYLAFDSNKAGSKDIYVIPSKGGPVRRITQESSQDDMPSWSQDGKWIYFHSNRGGTSEIWKIPTSGGTAVQVTNDGGADAFESSDGKFVYYAKPGQPGIWRKPVAGGVETLILRSGSPNHWGLFDKGVCAVDLNASAGPTINCLDLPSNRLTTISTLPRVTRINEGGSSFSVSHDGRWILYVSVERQQSDITVVENFR